MKTHWTGRSIRDFVFRIAADFVVQLENKMESIPITQEELAKKLGKTPGRVSQIFNDPGNFTLERLVEYSKALDMKVAIVAYEDDDPKNEKGPINSEIFKICWEKSGKPRDFWAFQETSEGIQKAENFNQSMERKHEIFTIWDSYRSGATQPEMETHAAAQAFSFAGAN